MKYNIFFFIFMIVTVLFFATPNKAEASYKEYSCSKHKIYCHIKRLRPYMNHYKAMRWSNLIYKASKKYKVNPHITVAIGMQESGLRGINRTDYALHYSGKKLVVTKVITDLGIFQFHAGTIKDSNMDPERLINDEKYYFYQHAKLLAKKIKICKKQYGDEAWGCYHSNTKKQHDKYIKLVTRYL